MVKGLYTAYTGMRNEQKRMDILTNNLANTDTTGFKKEGVTNQSFDSVLAYRIKDQSTPGTDAHRIGSMSLGVKIGEVYTDFSQGSFKVTDGTFDMAISGSGFFSVEFADKQGNTSVMYTRDGNFAMNKDGDLVTQDGDFILDINGQHIRMSTTASETLVARDGGIYQDGKFVATLGMTDFEDTDHLEKYGENLYIALDSAEKKDFTGEVRQGYLEASNVETVHEMVELINITRAYETSQRVIRTIDSTLEVASTQLGRLQ